MKTSIEFGEMMFSVVCKCLNTKFDTRENISVLQLKNYHHGMVLSITITHLVCQTSVKTNAVN